MLLFNAHSTALALMQRYSEERMKEFQQFQFDKSDLYILGFSNDSRACGTKWAQHQQGKERAEPIESCA